MNARPIATIIGTKDGRVIALCCFDANEEKRKAAINAIRAKRPGTEIEFIELKSDIVSVLTTDL